MTHLPTLTAAPKARVSAPSTVAKVTPEPAPPGRACPPAARPQGWLPEFMAAFFTVFIAELGDKTQIATLLMAAESQSPWVVFAGAAAALMATSLLGVVVGRWLSRRLSPQALQTATGASLLLVAVLLLWDVVNL